MTERGASKAKTGIKETDIFHFKFLQEFAGYFGYITDFHCENTLKEICGNGYFLTIMSNFLLRCQQFPVFFFFW